MRAIVRVIAAVGLALALLAATSGLAAASDPLIGKSYKEASATVAGWGVPVVIGTTVGSVMGIDDCTVISWQKTHRSLGGKPSKQVVLMNLNCNSPFATAGLPGASVASPEAKAAKAASEKAQKTAEWCAQPAQASYAPCGQFWASHEELHASMEKEIQANEAKAWKTAVWCAQPEQATYEPCGKFWSEHEELRAPAEKLAEAKVEKDQKTAQWCSLPEQATYEPCAEFWASHKNLRPPA